MKRAGLSEIVLIFKGDDKTNRYLDGVFFRVKRDGKFENVCFSDLDYAERHFVMKDKSSEWLMSLCDAMAECISEIGEQFNIVSGREGEEQ